MLKTNSKKAFENIRSYIVDNFVPDNYGLEPSTDFVTVANHIYNDFRVCTTNDYQWGRVAEGVIFEDWMQGLPSIFGADYYLHCTALDDLGVILEETPSEKARFTEDDAAKLLTSLIYREIKKAVKK